MSMVYGNGSQCQLTLQQWRVCDVNGSDVSRHIVTSVSNAIVLTTECHTFESSELFTNNDHEHGRNRRCRFPGVVGHIVSNICHYIYPFL